MKKNAGFTLIEIIAVLILVGILSTMAGIGIAKGVEGYLFARSNVEATQRAQLALSRISIELAQLSDIDTASSSGTALVFSTPAGSKKIGLDGTTIKWADSATELTNGDILADGVNATDGFNVTYVDTSDISYNDASTFTDPKDLARIELRLRLDRPDVSAGYLEFTTSIVPRNTGVKSAPTG